MSNWNRNLSDVVLTSAEATSSVVMAERTKVKVGYPLLTNFPSATFVNDIFGDVESATCIVSWDGHKRIPDEKFQQYILSCKFHQNTMRPKNYAY